MSTGVNIKKCLVGLIYRHPGPSIADFTIPISEFLLKINIIRKKGIRIFWDVHINSLKIDEENSANKYLNEINSFGLKN